MAQPFLHVCFCFILTLAYTQHIPIGIIVDVDERDVITILKRMIARHNSEQTSSNHIIISPSWYIANINNNCDLIRAICQRLDAGVFLLLGSSSSRSYNIIQSYSHALHVPYVVYSQNVNQPRDGYDYDVTVSPGYVTAVAELIKFFNWEKVYYVFDSDDALWELQRLHDYVRLPPNDVMIDARRLRNVTSSHDFLRQLDRFSTHTKRIILNLSSRDAYQKVLNQLVDVGMNRDNYHYLLSGPYIDSLDLRSFLYGGVNVTGFRLPIDLQEVTPSWARVPALELEPLLNKRISTDAALAADGLQLVINALNDLKVSNATRHIFKTFRHSELYNNGTRGVQCWRHPPLPWVHGPVIRQALLKSNFTGITGPLTINSHGQRVGHRLDLMQLDYRNPLRKVGSWSETLGLTTNLTRPKANRVQLDVNRTRVVTTILENPFVMRKCPSDGTPCQGHAQYEGYCIDLLKKVAEIVKFDYAIKLVNDTTYGTRLDDGSWNGMIGELISSEADIAIASLTITEVRERVVDFSKPFMDLGTSIMIKKPDKEKGGVFSFKNPLSDGVWISIICGFFGVSVVLFFVGRFSPYEWAAVPGVKDGRHRAKPAFSLANTVWFALGALMQQGSDIYPRSISGRIVGSVWWFFTLIIISSYTANLAAFLTIERMDVTINSVDDLARQTEIRYGITANGSTEDFFSQSNVSVYEKMWNFMKNTEPSVFVKTTQEGIERVRNSKGKYAFLLDSSFNEYHNQRKPCNTMKVGRNLDVKGYGIATPLGSDLRASINIAVLELNEIGELLKLHQKWWYDKGQCAAESGKESKTSALTLSNVSGIFHILIGGLILSMVTAFFDFILKNRMRSEKKITVVVKTSGNHSRDTRGGYRQRRTSDENGDCRYATLDAQSAFDIEHHHCRHRDRDEPL
ncbi:glutamate receptor subunit protein GluR2 precursor [Aplysia californica]|uniref:Glutamate receptor subunit protein GluR2 n=1 Tax=Aplysia californica TaxID=6500 RepID=Q7Z1H8_APLCA|nr:glutamate receptor subunit protein GluR2 precursor [Aplysia californica]AAP41204.1 glutamate receptor subunit protein GluR2 [Aplysia californica]